MNKKIIVIKIGSGILVTKRCKLDEFRISHIASQVALLIKAGIGVVLVVSGAVACGARFISINENQKSKQVAAGIGQVILISTLNRIFNKKNLQIAQILLKKDSTNLHAIREICCLYINSGFIPVINENDVIDLYSFGGNDYLSADISFFLRARGLIILSQMKKSDFSVGGGDSKREIVQALIKKNIKTTIVNGKVKNIILKTIL